MRALIDRSSLPDDLAAPGLPLDERHHLALRAQAGDFEAERRLLASCGRLVLSIARRVARTRAADLDDLVAAGLRAAAEAVRRYDGEGRFAAFLFATVRGAILREADAVA